MAAVNFLLMDHFLAEKNCRVKKKYLKKLFFAFFGNILTLAKNFAYADHKNFQKSKTVQCWSKLFCNMFATTLLLVTFM